MAGKEKTCQAKGCRFAAKHDITFNRRNIKVCDNHQVLDGAHFYYSAQKGGEVQCRCSDPNHK